MDGVPICDSRKSDSVLFQFRLDLAPAGGLHRLQETGQQFFLRRFPETPASEMFDDGIHIGLIDGAEAHAQRLSVNHRYGSRHIVCPVEVGDDAVGEIGVGITVAVHKLVDDVERLELIVGVILFFVVVEMEVAYGDLAVVLIGEFLLFTVSFRVFPSSVL